MAFLSEHKEVNEDQLESEVPSSAQPASLLTSAEYPLIGDPEQIAASEHFAVMRSRLLNAHRSGIHSVLITSAQKGEGKTLVSTNLAISIAQLNRHRVLLVDGDLRVCGITRLWGLQAESGLADFLQGTALFEAVVRPSRLPFLSLVGAGNLGAGALPAVLEGPKWAEFLRVAKDKFDLIIVDSVPTIAPIADFELLSAPCDGILFIVHLHKTERQSVETTLGRMNGKLLGVVVNNAEPQVGRDYYSYYYAKKRGSMK
jgi:capsular exopolysaccharide synthesis family protein